MRLGSIVRASFQISLVLSVLSAYLKLTHIEGAGTWLASAIIFSVIFILTAIYEVSSSNLIDRSEKIMWIIGFIFFCVIAGLIYLLSGRKRVVPNQ